MFQATKWGWKRVAARLLLLPVLAGGTAAAADSPPRANVGGPAAGKPVGAMQAAQADPKLLLKEGRKALAAGNFDAAQDLAHKAEANNPSGKWGLFDDTPSSLQADVQAARSKADKAQCEKLVKQAKELAGKHAANDAERAYNLDTALQMARRADQMHGPYSAWDMGDRPDKLVKDIEAARAKIKGAATPPATAGVSGTGQPFASTLPPGGGAGVKPAAGTNTPGGAMTAGVKPTSPVVGADPKKAAAVKLLGEGKQLIDKGDFVGAKVKYTAADNLGAAFGPQEYSPSYALQELNTRGTDAIARLLKESQTQSAKKDYVKADAALTAASDIAVALSLFQRPIEEAKASLRLATGGKYGGREAVAQVPPVMPVMPALPLPPAGPLAPSGVATVAGPVAPPGVASVGGPVSPMTPAKPAMPPATGGNVTGRQLLDQAVVEYQKGDLEMSARLARQAYNQGMQDEARSLLNQIDAETLKIKQMTAAKSYEAAVAAVQNKDHGHALSVLVLIDPNLLPGDMRARRDDMIASCRVELEKNGGKAVVATGGMEPPMLPPGGELQPLPMGANPPGSARVGDPKTANPDALANQVDAMKKVTFQKLRSDGLKVQADSQAAFGRGDTDVAIQMLLDYSNRVRSANLEPGSVALLLRPIDSRLEMFRVMKGQADALAREKKDKTEAKSLIAGRGAADEQRKAEVGRLVREYHGLVKQSKWVEAERVAMQAKQLDPDDPAIAALATVAKMRRRVDDYEKIKDNKENIFRVGLNDAEKEGPVVTIEDPIAVQLQAAGRARRRGSLDDVYLKSRTPKEFEIELQLDKPISIEFNQTPLDQAVENLRSLTGLPFSWDDAALEAEGVSRAKPVSERLPGVSARNALHLLLDKAGLSFVIEYETVRITTIKKAKGRLFTKVFSVADLVTPIPNFALPDYANFEMMLNRNGLNSGHVQLQGMNAGGSATPYLSSNSLGGGTPLPGSTLPPNSPTGVSGGLPAGDQRGTLQPSGFGSGSGNGPNPLSGSAHMAPDRNTKHEQLIRLITGMVRPYSWDGMGGPGKVEYFDLGSALVVNQTADVIREVADLLEALRRLQDLAVAVEVRIVSLSETWFERMGVDFGVNVNTNNTKFEPSLTTNQFVPEPFVNKLIGRGATVGLSPAGAGQPGGPNFAFTPDLGVPIQATSFPYAIPGFGGYPNNPGFNGGLSLGLAFLNDIQVYMFMEAAQGDRRVNVMQAPKLTLFNGQTATISVNDLAFFVTSVTVVSVNGQIVFIPNNTPLPGPGQGGINVSLQAVVTADRRFVRINIPINMSAQTGATVPLFPVTTFITPVFEGGSQGVPIPFTQFLQQPSFTSLNIQTTVVCPDGGTVLLGGLKTLSEGRNEFGPPFLSKIPYLNRLFKNVGIGRETTHIMIMITPRIIINAEEEVNQTGGGGTFGTGPGQ